MTNALIYRALERNTGTVGGKSNPCTSITAVNPEIAALQQHQDPASDGAAATNKQIALNLAIQIASIGGDPQAAINSGTFAPGNLDDDTGKGNTCERVHWRPACFPNLMSGQVTHKTIRSVASLRRTSLFRMSRRMRSALPSRVVVQAPVRLLQCPTLQQQRRRQTRLQPL